MAKKSVSDLFTSEEFKNKITDIAKSYALPTLIASAGTGALGAYLASRNEIQHESPKARRKRILRSALFPSLTSLAIAGSIGTINALSGIDTDKEIDDPNSFNPGEAIFDTVVQNASIPVGTGLGLAHAGGSISFPQELKGKRGGKSSKNTAINKALLEFNTQDPSAINQFGTPEQLKKLEKTLRKNKVLAKILTHSPIKTLPRISFKRSMPAVAGLGTAGLLGGVLADKFVDSFLY